MPKGGCVLVKPPEPLPLLQAITPPFRPETGVDAAALPLFAAITPPVPRKAVDPPWGLPTNLQF